jgi:NADPH-dependent ferric siderophore reductase
VSDLDAIPTHVTEVERCERRGDTFVRVTFAGGLDRFRPIAPDQFVYVLLPPPGRTVLPVTTDFRWTEFDEMAERDRPIGAYYTVRQFRPEAGELTCDVFLHDPAGAASTALADVVPGTPAALWGPRTAWSPPLATSRWLLVADETGVPAAQVILESLPTGADVTVLVEVDDAGGLDVAGATFLPRGGAKAGTTDLLVEAVRGLDLESAGLYAWGGAESRAMRDVRRHLRGAVGLARQQVSMTPYWRHPAHAADADDD